MACRCDAWSAWEEDGQDGAQEYCTYLGTAKCVRQLSEQRLADGNYDRTRVREYTGQR